MFSIFSSVSATNHQIFFHINKLLLLPWLLWQKGSWSGIFPLGVVSFQGGEVECFFGPWMAIQEKGSSLLYDVFSGFHSHAKQVQTEFSFFTECLFHGLFLDVTTKLTQKNGIASHRIPSFNDQRTEWVKGRKKNVLILQSLTVYAWNPKMTSQSGLDPFSCDVILDRGSTQVLCLGGGQHLKEESRAKNFLTTVNRAVEKVNLCKQINVVVSGTLRVGIC